MSLHRQAIIPPVSAATGWALSVAGAGTVTATAFGLRTRLPAALVASILALAGAAVGAGALLLQAHASVADWVFTLAVLGILAPVHVRVVGGRFGSISGTSGR